MHYFAGGVMPTVARVGVFKLQVFADDHVPAHFHIVGPDFEVLVAMSDSSILKGKRYHREVQSAMAWAQANLDVLQREWIRLNER